MQRNAEFTEFTLSSFLFEKLKGIPFLTVLIGLFAYTVDQIEIKVIHMALLQLLFKNGFHILLFFHKFNRHLC